MGKSGLCFIVGTVDKRRKRKTTTQRIMADKDTQVLVTEKTYEVDKSDFLVIQGFDQSKTWYNKTAGFMDTLRLIPRLLMICYGGIFWISTQWFMNLPEPSNAQAAFISTIVGAGAAWFGLYVGSGHKPASKK